MRGVEPRLECWVAGCSLLDVGMRQSWVAGRDVHRPATLREVGRDVLNYRRHPLLGVGKRSLSHPTRALRGFAGNRAHLRNVVGFGQAASAVKVGPGHQGDGFRRVGSRGGDCLGGGSRGVVHREVGLQGEGDTRRAVGGTAEDMVVAVADSVRGNNHRTPNRSGCWR